MRELMDTLRGPAKRARPVVLVPAGHRLVRFAGRRGGEGPLTTGQRNTLSWVRNENEFARMVDWGLDLPPGATLDDITAAFAILLARHESLRTCYPDRDDAPVQHVIQHGELTIDLYAVAAPAVEPDAAEPSAAPPGAAESSRAEPGGQAPSPAAPSAAELVMSLIGQLRSAEFDLSSDLPVRIGVAVDGDVPLAAAAVYSHMAADMLGMAVVGQQFTELAAEPARRQPDEPGHQPLDQAVMEHSPRGHRITRAALRTWQARLRAVPQCTYVTPQASAEGQAAATEPAAAWLWSRAAALALPHVADRSGVSRQAAVLAALCAVLSHRSGQPDCAFTALMHNRFERRLREYVGSLASDTLITVDTRADSLDQLARRAAMTTLRAGKGCAVDGDELGRLVRAVEVDRGISYARDCTYNDTSYIDMVPPESPGSPCAARAALPASELHFVAAADIGTLLAVFLWQVEGELLLGAMTSDTGRMPRADIEALLRGVELLLVEAATADVKLDRVREITGVTPLPRGPGWVLTDSCWVELAEVRRLVADSLPGVPALVTAEDTEDSEPELTAWLAPSGPLTPEEAHAACMAVLPAGPQPPASMRYSAMAPARYVICATAPPDVANLEAWRRQPVRAAGPGRPPPPASPAEPLRAAAGPGPGPSPGLPPTADAGPLS
jgi:hypothetical protein